jgi:hypothetical protein
MTAALPIPELSPSNIKDFWSHIDKSGDCWTWTGRLTETGYGLARYTVSGKRHGIRAHRLAYELTVGPIPDGMQVDHICHNRACSRPEHLRAATHKQNQENLVGAQARNQSGVRGVTWYARTNVWQGNVRHNKKLHHVGYFATIAEAERAVIATRNQLFTHNDMDRVA